MNYYIQGNKEKADQIKAAFEAKGCVMHTGNQCDLSDMIYYSLNGKVGSIKLRNLDLFKSHPNYKELELPVQPKFKVGDWIACDADSFTLSIKSVRDENYYFHQGGSLPIKDIDEHYHLWTIQDAKDGDVLCTYEDNKPKIVFIYKDGDRVLLYHCFHNMLYSLQSFVTDVQPGCLVPNGNVKPATQEQYRTLFKKMRDDGYEWDADKKELKKIQPHYDIKNFHVGTPVLVREYDTCHWQWVQYSHFNGVGLFFAAGKTWRQCIPFEGNEHLLGTTDMPSEEYINW